jgi:hypothetical protein
MEVKPAHPFLDVHAWTLGDLVFNWYDIMGLVINIEHREIVDAPENAIGYAVDLCVLLSDGTVVVWNADSVRRIQKLDTPDIRIDNLWTIPVSRVPGDLD